VNNEHQTLRFCHGLLGFGIKRCRAMANFVMSLASSPTIADPVELAGSRFCHYHYSNLTKVLRHWKKEHLPENQLVKRKKTFKN